MNDTDIIILTLTERLKKAEAELEAEFAEFKADIALLLDQKDDYQEKLFEENEALKAELDGLKKILSANNMFSWLESETYTP